MKISTICAVSPQRNFKANTIDFYEQKFKEKERKSKLQKGLFALAIIGAAGIGLSILNKRPDIIKNSLTKNKNKFSKHFAKKRPEVDPVIKLLNGKRDSEAVIRYNSYIADKKIASLQHKFLNGGFKNKNQKAIGNIMKNLSRHCRISAEAKTYNNE